MAENMKAWITINRDNSGVETFEGRVLAIGNTHVKVEVDSDYNKLRHPIVHEGEWFPLNGKRVKVKLNN